MRFTQKMYDFAKKIMYMVLGCLLTLKTLGFILISLVLGIISAPVSHTANDEVKLIGAPEGKRNRTRMPVDIAEDSIILGVHDVDVNDIPGGAKIFTRDRNKWEQTALLVPNDQAEIEDGEKRGQAGFGFAVSISGPVGRRSADYAIVGAPGHDGVAKNAGAAYIYAASEKDWKQEAKLFASDAAEGDAFGHVVSIDGTTTVIGAPKDDDADSNSGAAYIFVRDGNTWKQQAKLVPQDSGRSDAVGDAVMIGGGTVVVGAPGHSPGGIRFAGAAYVFVRDGERWRQQTKLTAEDAEKSDRFGGSVNINGDTIIVGSLLNDAGGIKDAGAAYIFVRSGNDWRQQVKLIAPKKRAGARFGAGVATTGKIAIVGSPLRDKEGLNGGTAYSFVNVDGVWEDRKIVVPDDAGLNLLFGSTIAISRDTVVVGAGAAPEGGAGFGNGTAAYVYSGEAHFNTPPFALESFGLGVTTLGRIKRTALFQNFPNPFNPETWLPYRLATDAPVTFRIYNVQGQLTCELNLGTQKAGGYLTRETAAYWDGRDQVGETVSSGVYFYTLLPGSFQGTRRMLILK